MPIFGYTHIPQKWAKRINEFNSISTICTPILTTIDLVFSEITIDAKGKQRKQYRYENMMTPYDKLKSLPNSEKYLKPGLSFCNT